MVGILTFCPGVFLLHEFHSKKLLRYQLCLTNLLMAAAILVAKYLKAPLIPSILICKVTAMIKYRRVRHGNISLILGAMFEFYF